MCYYNSCRIAESSTIDFMGIKKELTGLRLNRPVQTGFDYLDWPVIKPLANGRDYEIQQIHWEYIPATIYDEFDLRDARLMFKWFNVKGETLLKNEKGKPTFFSEGARHGRCLALSSGFFEWRQVPGGKSQGRPEKIPYFITLKTRPEYFFMAGIHRVWTNRTRNQSADTFGIVTTTANTLMEKIHNTKKRMPVILPEELAVKWISHDLRDSEIATLGMYQYDASDMIAWPVSTDFLKKKDPQEECYYNNLPSL